MRSLWIQSGTMIGMKELHLDAGVNTLWRLTRSIAFASQINFGKYPQSSRVGLHPMGKARPIA
jgi:hypothetical protein